MVWQTMKAAKGRVFLTVLGIVIAAAALTVVFGVGRSVEDLILGQLRGLGSDLIGVIAGAESSAGAPAAALGVTVKTLTGDDLRALRFSGNAPHILAAAGYVTGSAPVKSDLYEGFLTYYGVSADIVKVENITVEKGIFFSEAEEKTAADVAVLGAQRAQDFFGSAEAALGRKFTLAGRKFTVVGVLRPRGTVAFVNQDMSVYVPLRTAQRKLLGIDYLNFIRIKVDGEENIARTREDIDRLLAARHRLAPDEDRDYTIKDLKSAIESVRRISDTLTYLLLIVAGVSLLSGGIGIMNMMFISLSTRLRQIGLRKALGATEKDIAAEFLIESVLISTLGALIGVLLGLAVSAAISVSAQAFGYEYRFFIPWDGVAISFAAAAIVGALFGFYPAKKGGRVSPMEALRYE